MERKTGKGQKPLLVLIKEAKFKLKNPAFTTKCRVFHSFLSLSIKGV